ncbi:alpha/beta hydrolase [Nocardia pseudobrasiliensis]|uniref:Alpha/beta hydrolase family protein n=1 Tax=Nocardia pseudobrasiliensis TaxID=45979 RepID=A0A370IBM8_9NOCA|nr:alpha/beta hydrolase [Nocardia pseudobrasiliensis]RDI68020.1 alpha/beta hydrolase family protein [Nocardia pseudobrasiliensis]
MSGGLTVSQVLSWNPMSLGDQAREWSRQADDLRVAMDAQHRAVDGSHETFTGGAGDALRERFTLVYDKSRKVLEALEKARDAATIASLNFTTAKSLMDHGKRTAEGKGLRVDEDGACHIGEEIKQTLYTSVGGDRDKYNTALAALETDCATETATMRRLLDNAATIDANAVIAIGGAFVDLPAPDTFGNASAPKSEISPQPKNGTPQQNRAWWDSLTPVQQREEIGARPADIGNLDGLPADVKDRANRNRIPIERARLERDLAAANADLAGDPTDGEAARRIVDGRKRLQDLRAVEEVIAPEEDRPPRKLIFLDMESGRQGRAAVAVGDPDHADHISVATPGLGSNLNRSLAGMVGEADTLKTESEWQLSNAGSTHRGETVAAIAWFGYDPPQGGVDNPQPDTANVMWEGRAQEGAKPLADFYRGLDVASAQNDPHITALGHSYGSLTTSLALQQKAGGVDDVVFYGSPGLGGHVPAVGASGLGGLVNPAGALLTETGLNDTVHNAGDLGLRDHHVYEMTERGDPVAYADRFGRSPAKLDWITHLDTDPITVDDRYYSGASGHAEYPRTDSGTGNLHRSGYNLAAVVSGLPDNAIDGGHR